MRIKELPAHARPRERAMREGVSRLSFEDLLTILIQSGTKEKSAREVAQSLLVRYPTKRELSQITFSQLKEISGIGPAKAIELLSAVELGRRLFLESDWKEKIILRTSSDTFQYMKGLYREAKQEMFYCLYLNSQCELIERRLLFMGTINRSLVHPREVFKYAYLNSASSIICVHNHPSNDLKPSREDNQLTQALVELGKLNAIPVVDHLIVGEDGYYSFYEDGKIFNM